MKNFNKKPPYGKRLLPQVLDNLAISTPDRLYASIAYSSNVSEGFRDVTVREMAHAVDYCANWLHGRIGRSANFETIAYMGIPDLCGAVVFLAAVKCGYKVLLPSPRNPVMTNVSLIEQTGCKNLLHSSQLVSIVKGMRDVKESLKFTAIPSFEEMVKEDTKHYPFDVTFEETKHSPIVVLHSSGSTGIPKPVVMTHGTFAIADNDRNLPKVKGRKNLDFSFWDSGNNYKFFSVFPPFHLAGFINTIVRPIFGEGPVPVLGPPQRPPSGPLVSEVMKNQEIRGLYIPPSIAEQVLQQPSGLDYFKKLDFFCYSGGPLSPSAGALISQVTQVCQFYGSTETSLIQQLVPSSEDWAYMEWHPSCKLEMQPSEDEAYEMILYISQNSEEMSALSYNFPDTQIWRTKDLFKPHPTKPGLWRFHGRKDDIIVLSNSEKFNPVAMEITIQGHPLLSGALVVGQGKSQAALLIEPKSETQDESLLMKEVWPFVEKANLHAPGQARIIPSKILLAHPDKPFQRAAKGTVVRKLTERSYALEIQALYAEDRVGDQQGGSFVIASNSLDDVKKFVRSTITGSFPGPGIANNEDLFVMGLDSLKTAEIAGKLRIGLQRQPNTSNFMWLSTETIYSNPTIDQLSEILHDFLSTKEISETQNSKTKNTRTTRMASTIEKYTQDLPNPRHLLDLRLREGQQINVALTGSSGFLGCYILRTLLHDHRVSQIYCLDRSADVRKKHETLFQEEGILLENLATKAHYFVADYSHDTLGLAPSAFIELKENVDVILHNAWKVDFNHSLQSFEDTHIRGTRHLLDLSADSQKNPRIVFISSVASVANWATVYGEEAIVPETALENGKTTATLGYGESKHVAERILTIASERCKVPISILRVGQIAGSTVPGEVAWPVQEWVPSLIITSRSLRLLPNNLPPVNWIPINYLATVILEIVHSDVTTGDAQFYNLVNPQSATWNSLLGPIQRHLGPHVKTVQFTEWISKLEELDRFDETQLIDKPALKLIGFFKQLQTSTGLVKYDTQHSTTVSKTLLSIGPVKPDWIEVWLKQWRFE